MCPPSLREPQRQFHNIDIRAHRPRPRPRHADDTRPARAPYKKCPRMLQGPGLRLGNGRATPPVRRGEWLLLTCLKGCTRRGCWRASFGTQGAPSATLGFAMRPRWGRMAITPKALNIRAQGRRRRTLGPEAAARRIPSRTPFEHSSGFRGAFPPPCKGGVRGVNPARRRARPRRPEPKNPPEPPLCKGGDEFRPTPATVGATRADGIRVGISHRQEQPFIAPPPGIPDGSDRRPGTRSSDLSLE